MKKKRFVWTSLVVIAFLVMTTMNLTGIAAATALNFATTLYTPIEEQEFIRAQILRPFTAKTGIEVKMTNEDYAPFMDRLIAEAKAKKVNTNVLGTLHGDFPFLVSQKIPQNLTKIKQLTGRTFIPQLLKLGQIGGKQVYAPWSQATYLMIANKKALPYLPKGADINALTYDQLLDWAKNLSEKTGSAKFGLPAGPKGLFGRMLHGYLYPSFTGSQVQKFNSPEAVKLWQYLKELYKYSHPSSLVYENMAEPLLLEEVWLAWDHTARIGPALKEKPDQFVVFPAPAGPKGRAFITVINGLGIPVGAKNTAAAWKLIDYFTQPEVQVKVLQGTGFFPTTYEATSYVPAGSLKLLAEAVAKQAGSSDSIVSLLPIGLGTRSGEFVPIYTTAFQSIVVQGKPIDDTLKQQEGFLLKLFKETNAPYPQP